jgi:hypothetical protein
MKREHPETIIRSGANRDYPTLFPTGGSDSRLSFAQFHLKDAKHLVLLNYTSRVPEKPPENHQTTSRKQPLNAIPGFAAGGERIGTRA